MSRQTRYSPEVRERAVRMVLEHQREYESQWAAIGSIAAKIGCTPETLRKWVRRAKVEQGVVRGALKSDERENRELRRANEILRKASAFFAQAELERRNKT